MRINEKAKSKNIFLRKRVKFRFTKKSVCVCVLFFSTHTHTHTKTHWKGYFDLYWGGELYHTDKSVYLLLKTRWRKGRNHQVVSCITCKKLPLYIV